MANKITHILEKMQKDEKTGRVTNYMGNDSFRPDPVMALKMAAASSVFGEPQYYRGGMTRPSYLYRAAPDWLKPYLIITGAVDSKDSSAYMEDLIDRALDADFGAVLELAAELRTDYYARLNPQVIMVRAAVHPKRAAFNEKYPGKFREIEEIVMSRADEPAVQASYYLYMNHGKKAGIPSVLKRSWADRLERASAYEMRKYKNAEIGMIDTVRLCHAKGERIDELLRTGTIQVEAEDKTWEDLRSAGMTWKEILATIRIPHMALLRNLRGIAEELGSGAEDREILKKVLQDLEAGVPYGKQYPFRYYTAYKTLENEGLAYYKPQILTSLSRCMKLALDNMPEMRGRVMVLTDNSGSAWGTIPSEYGKVTVAEIDNLSAVITAMKAEEGYVGVFGDRLVTIPIDREGSIMEYMKKINAIGKGIGGATENGIWLFFEQAVRQKEHWDTVFIYSDMQAGYSGLYGTDRGAPVRFVQSYGKKYLGDTGYINVVQMLEIYRENVYRDVNVFTVQTAGYDNSILPQTLYRTAILYGWTGKEAIYADRMISLWDEQFRQK
ncbi:MAG: hypothetical protein IKG46_08995 [Solobacterium sp.]|nr:hypothetical protein [Solobacterium sp.]